jgi:hypothetical protein
MFMMQAAEHGSRSLRTLQGNIEVDQVNLAASSKLGSATPLHLDTKKGRLKRGVASRKHKPGTLRRFVDLIQ